MTAGRDRSGPEKAVAAVERLSRAIEAAFSSTDRAVSTTGFRTVFTAWFGREGPRSYEEALRKADDPATCSLHFALRRQGVRGDPSAFKRIYIPTDHTNAVVDQRIEALRAAATVVDLFPPPQAWRFTRGFLIPNRMVRVSSEQNFSF